MAELLVIVLVLVYSVWSEVNKKKQEENVDIDFSELASLDDFFKDSGTTTATKHPVKAASPKAKQKYKAKKAASQPTNYDDYSALNGQVNYERRPEIARNNYDELPQLTGTVNYDRMSSSENAAGDQLSEEDRKMFELGHTEQPKHQGAAHPIKISFDRNSVIKAFVMSEVLQRYDIERIYARIPGINQPQDE